MINKFRLRNPSGFSRYVSRCALTLSIGLLGSGVYALSPWYIVSNQTLNGDFGPLVIGVDENGVAAPGVTVAINGGTVESIYATNSSMLDMAGGTISGPMTLENNTYFSIANATVSGALSATDSNLLVSDGSTLHSLHLSGFASSTIGGGTITNGIVVTGSSSVSFFATPITSTIEAHDNTTIELSGGTITSGLKGLDNANLFVNGGSVSHLTTSETSSAFVSGGTISGAIEVGGNSTIHINGNELTVSNILSRGFYDQATMQNHEGVSLTLTGTLSDGSTINNVVYSAGDFVGDDANYTFHGTAGGPIAIDAVIDANTASTGGVKNVVQIDGATVTLDQTTDFGNTTIDNGSTVELNGGAIRGETQVNGGTLTAQAGSTVAAVAATGTSSVHLSDTTATGPATVSQSATLTATNSAIHSSVSASGNSAVSIAQTLVSGDITATDTATAQISTSTVAGTVKAQGNANTAVSTSTVGGVSASNKATVHVSDTTVSQSVSASDESKLTLTTTTIQNNLSADQKATIQVNDSTINGSFTVDNKATVKVNNSTISQSATASGQSTATFTNVSAAKPLTVTQNATVNVSGGNYNGGINGGGTSTTSIASNATLSQISAVQTSKFFVNGATISLVSVHDSGYVRLNTGSIGEIKRWGGSVLITGGLVSPHTLMNFGGSSSTAFNLFGSDFLLSNPRLDMQDGIPGVSWDLTGTLRNGDALGTTYFEAGGNLIKAQGITFNAATAAEPTPLILIATLVPTLARLRRKRRCENS